MMIVTCGGVCDTYTEMMVVVMMIVTDGGWL